MRGYLHHKVLLLVCVLSDGAYGQGGNGGEGGGGGQNPRKKGKKTQWRPDVNAGPFATPCGGNPDCDIPGGSRFNMKPGDKWGFNVYTPNEHLEACGFVVSHKKGKVRAVVKMQHEQLPRGAPWKGRMASKIPLLTIRSNAARQSGMACFGRCLDPMPPDAHTWGAKVIIACQGKNKGGGKCRRVGFRLQCRMASSARPGPAPGPSGPDPYPQPLPAGPGGVDRSLVPFPGGPNSAAGDEDDSSSPALHWIFWLVALLFGLMVCIVLIILIIQRRQSSEETQRGDQLVFVDDDAASDMGPMYERFAADSDDPFSSEPASEYTFEDEALREFFEAADSHTYRDDDSSYTATDEWDDDYAR